MPTLDDGPQESIKMLLIGDSGSGKTSALGSLAKAGYDLFILDFDNGLDVLRDPDIVPRDCRKHIHYVTLTDPMKMGPGGKVIPRGTPSAWADALGLLTNWRTKDGKYAKAGTEPDEDFGPISEWGPDRVLVLDSFTFLGNAIMRHVAALNNKLGERPTLPMWGDAGAAQETLLQMLYDASIKCHVIITAHISYIGTKNKDDKGQIIEEDLHGYPSALGRALPPKVGRYFNTVVRAVTRGTGQAAKRKLRTRSEQQVDLKVPISAIPVELPLEDGLATIFAKIQEK